MISNLKRCLSSFVVAGLLFVAGPAFAQPAGSCDLRELRGAYAFSLHGFNPDGEPTAVVGSFQLDRAGNLTGTYFRNEGGERTGPVEFYCGLALSADCVASGPCNDVGEPAEVVMDVAFVPGGRELHLMVSPLAVPSAGGISGMATRR